jgi:hypothetical protein
MSWNAKKGNDRNDKSKVISLTEEELQSVHSLINQHVSCLGEKNNSRFANVNLHIISQSEIERRVNIGLQRQRVGGRFGQCATAIEC